MEEPTNQPENEQNIPPVQYPQNTQIYKNHKNRKNIQNHKKKDQISNRETNEGIIANQSTDNNSTIQKINPNFPKYNGISYILSIDPLTELNNCSSVLIKQEPDIINIITGFRTECKYNVFGKTNNGYIYLFECLEKSSCYMRCCCNSASREFDINIFHVGSGMKNLFANIYKPFKCVCCGCCKIPKMVITLSDGKKIGKIFNSIDCCDPQFEIYDSNRQLKYFSYGDFCQIGFCCKCFKADFIIFDKKNGNKVGKLTKIEAECIEIISKADSYKMKFPKTATSIEKLLLICFSLMIDYHNFENRPLNLIGILKRY